MALAMSSNARSSLTHCAPERFLKVGKMFPFTFDMLILAGEAINTG